MGKTLQAREESGAQPVSSAPSASHEYLLFCSFFCPEFHQVSLDEIIYLAIHHTIDIGAGSWYDGLSHDGRRTRSYGSGNPIRFFFFPASTFACSSIRCCNSLSYKIERNWRIAFSRFLGWSRVSVFSIRISSSSPV